MGLVNNLLINFVFRKAERTLLRNDRHLHLEDQETREKENLAQIHQKLMELNKMVKRLVLENEQLPLLLL